MLDAGATGRVAAIADEDRLALSEVGLREGCRVTVERRLPGGGPVLVALGAARIALARIVASRTLVEPGARDASPDAADAGWAPPSPYVSDGASGPGAPVTASPWTPGAP